MTSLPVPPRKQSRNFAFSQSANKVHKHSTVREFILYCVPNGDFAQKIQDLWDFAKSNGYFGQIGSQNYSIPHITLVSFFKAHEFSDFNNTIIALAQDGKFLNRTLGMDLYTSSNFMGYFIKEDDANVLQRISLKFLKEISESIINDTLDGFDHLIACFPYCATSAVTGDGERTSSRCIPKSSRSISLEPHVKNLHLTLAYQFPTNAYQNLLELVEKLDTTGANGWELRLYSRDPRLATKHVHKVIYSHSSREHDELELRVGDYIYVNSEAALQSVDGWVEGIAHNGNHIGFIPLNHTERVCETEVWKLHVTAPLVSLQQNIPVDNNEVSVDAIDGIAHTIENDFYIDNSQHFNQRPANIEEIQPQLTNARRSGRRIVILRHGERVDFAFGNAWTQFSFNDQTYVRMDLNMPVALPPRVAEDWEKDAPLTTLGSFQSQQVGMSFKNFGVNFSKVYVSPSYRCVQTASEILNAMELESIPMNVEYGLFEWCMWYEMGLPQFLSEKELGVIFNVNENYQPILTRLDLDVIMKESLEDFYTRSSSTMRQLLNNCDSDGDILIVAHAINLESCTRELVGKEQRSRAELRTLLMSIPYLAVVTLIEVEDDPVNHYRLIEPPCLTLTHNSCSKFDWRILDDN